MGIEEQLKLSAVKYLGSEKGIGREEIAAAVAKWDRDGDKKTLSRSEADYYLKAEGLPEPVRRLMLLNLYGFTGNKLSADELLARALSNADAKGRLYGVSLRRP